MVGLYTPETAKAVKGSATKYVHAGLHHLVGLVIEEVLTNMQIPKGLSTKIAAT